MRKTMARPFDIPPGSIAPRPLSVKETAQKYGASDKEVAAAESFARSFSLPQDRVRPKIRSVKARTKHK